MLDLRFGENFMKIQTKMAKLQMHDSLHKTVNEKVFLIFMQIFMSFYEWQLKQLISHMLLNPFKMVIQLFKIAPNFPNFYELIQQALEDKTP